MSLEEVEKELNVMNIEYSLCDDMVDENPVTSYLVVFECDYKGANIKVEFGYVLHRLTDAQMHKLASFQLWLQLFASDEEVESQSSLLKLIVNQFEIKVTPPTLLDIYSDQDWNNVFGCNGEDKRLSDFSDYQNPDFSKNITMINKLLIAKRDLKLSILSADQSRMIKIGDVWFQEHVVRASHLPLLNDLDKRIFEHKQELMLKFKM